MSNLELRFCISMGQVYELPCSCTRLMTVPSALIYHTPLYIEVRNPAVYQTCVDFEQALASAFDPIGWVALTFDLAHIGHRAGQTRASWTIVVAEMRE